MSVYRFNYYPEPTRAGKTVQDSALIVTKLQITLLFSNAPEGFQRLCSNTGFCQSLFPVETLLLNAKPDGEEGHDVKLPRRFAIAATLCHPQICDPSGQWVDVPSFPGLSCCWLGSSFTSTPTSDNVMLGSIHLTHIDKVLQRIRSGCEQYHIISIAQ
ncbi:hypothetical protein GWK47_035550 [Chionoecetes opilio]|uniref:Uncharacterized protein n=1 Tax=Chionoecetes opilio TaxID=41210 RepID=A0A8J4YF68_CHIOP|nr:hypothetical protein GWK47_035550 [Chionoecetes opilio]